MGTQLALLAQKEHLLQHLEEGKLVLGIFIDLSKTFDCYNHNLIIQKLERYGFRGNVASLIRCYLENRRQIFVINGYHLDPLPFSTGVPQGSILGPFLFNMYVNNIVKYNKSVEFIMYYNDTSILIGGKALMTLMNFTLANIDEWTRRNRLLINENKTKAVIFRAKNKHSSASSFNSKLISINATPIVITSSIKTLGVTFHEHMSWAAHVDSLASLRK